MKFSLFGYTFCANKTDEVPQLDSAHKNQIVIEKLKVGLEKFMIDRTLKYSEYRLQKMTKLSINTIKKYRPEIRKIHNRLIREDKRESELKREEHQFKKYRFEHPDINFNEVIKKRKTDESITLSKSENMKKLNQQRIDNNRKKIYDLLYSENKSEFKKANGEWHITKIADHLKLNRNTVAKYLKK